jgi:hypothetical protein
LRKYCQTKPAQVEKAKTQNKLIRPQTIVSQFIIEKNGYAIIEYTTNVLKPKVLIEASRLTFEQSGHNDSGNLLRK